MELFDPEFAIFPGKPQWNAENDIPDQTGKVVIVTGGNTGIGKVTVEALVSKGAKVYMGARSEQRAKESIDDINSRTKRPENLIWLKLDLADLSSVKEAVNEFTKKEKKLHLLYCNAGIMACPYSLTKDGFEIQWGTNVVGHFYLTKLLLPTLLSTIKDSAPGTVRVINTSSCAHNYAPKDCGINLEDTKLENQSTSVRYGQSKLGNILVSNELTRRYKDEGLVSISLHPGNIATELFRGPIDSWGLPARFFGWISTYLYMITPEHGAVTQLYAGTTDEVESKDLNGSYLYPYNNIGKGSKFAKDEELGKKLWNHLESELQKRNRN